MASTASTYDCAHGPRLAVPAIRAIPAQYPISRFMRDQDDNVIGDMRITAVTIARRYDEWMNIEGLVRVRLLAARRCPCRAGS